MDEGTRLLLEDVRRDLDDATQQISQAVSELEADDTTSTEALLGEAITRLRLLSQRVEEQLDGSR